MIKHRRDLITLLSNMPDQAFDWLVLALTADDETKQPRVWPRCLTGFDIEARQSVSHVRNVCYDYIEAGRGQMFTKKRKRA